MPDLSLVCVREDAGLAEALGEALRQFGFSICRSASVYESFQGYAAVIVLVSPGSTRSELACATAERALDYGKLVPVFVSFCQAPDRLNGVAMHDLSTWSGDPTDPIIQAIAAHAGRLAGLAGRPSIAAPSRAPAALPEPPEPAQSRRVRLSYEPPAPAIQPPSAARARPAYQPHQPPVAQHHAPHPVAPTSSYDRPPAQDYYVPPASYASEWRRAPAPEQPRTQQPPHQPLYPAADQDGGFLTPVDEGRGDRGLNPFGVEAPTHEAERQRFGGFVANAIHRRRGVTGAAVIVGATVGLMAALDHEPSKPDEHDFAQSGFALSEEP